MTYRKDIPLVGLIMLVVMGSATTSFGQCETDKIVASNGSKNNNFGRALDMDGEWAVVGAPGLLNGRAYVFRSGDCSWTEEAILEPADPDADDFGQSVAIHGEAVVVGAPEEFVDELDPFPPGGNDAGAVYYFELEDGDWNFKQRIFAATGGEFSDFGTSVQLSSTWLVAASPNDSNDNGDQAGSVFVYSQNRSGDWA